MAGAARISSCCRQSCRLLGTLARGVRPQRLPAACALQALSGLSGQRAGPAAALLAKLCLAAGDAPAAWRLLRSSLPAACAARPKIVLEVVEALFKQRRFQEVRRWLLGLECRIVQQPPGGHA